MLKLNYKIALFSLLTLTALSLPQANAGIDLEAYVGAIAAKSDRTINTTPAASNPTTNSTYTGTVYGAKLGYGIALLSVGGDFMMLSHGGEQATNFGPYAAIDLGFINFKATYFASSSAKSGNSTATGNGFKGGIGISVFPFVMINLEYLSLKYTKLTDSDITAGSGVSINSYNHTEAGPMVSVSLVF